MRQVPKPHAWKKNDQRVIDSNQRRAGMLTAGFLVTLIAIVGVLPVHLVRGDNGSSTLNYLAGAGFLCGLAPSACPDIASASNGDKVLLTGTGSLSSGDQDASGGGTFAHENSAGVVLASGTWKAQELVSFTSFGPSPAFPPTLRGGKAVLEVQLHASSGAEFDAVLVIGCVLDPTQAAIPGAFEGITLNVIGGPNFNIVAPFPDAGFTVFIAT